MDNLFSKYFAGYDLAYGQADMSRLEIDPITKKQKPSYRWNDEDITDQVYNDHLAGERSIGIQPCTKDGLARFGAIDVDFKDYEKYDRKKFFDTDKAIFAWIEKNRISVDRTDQMITELSATEINDLAMIAVASRQIISALA